MALGVEQAEEAEALVPRPPVVAVPLGGLPEAERSFCLWAAPHLHWRLRVGLTVSIPDRRV